MTSTSFVDDKHMPMIRFMMLLMREMLLFPRYESLKRRYGDIILSMPRRYHYEAILS